MKISLLFVATGGSFPQVAGAIVLDAVLDTLKLFPLLFVTYLFMEFLEHKTGSKMKTAVQKAGRVGPLVGSALGLLPQCGFSAVAAGLYSGRVITIGTLLAVFLSTSDEMLPVLIGSSVPIGKVLIILGIKFVVALAVGFAVDLIFYGRRRKVSGMAHSVCEEDHGCAEHHGDEAHQDCAEHHGDEAHQDCDGSRFCAGGHCHGKGGILRSSVFHALQISVFILMINLILSTLLTLVGKERITAFVGNLPVLRECLGALVGLIPNCAASVAIATLYAEGVIPAGVMLAGLLPGAGVGILILGKTNRPKRSTAAILGFIFLVGVILGVVFDLTPLGTALGI